MGEAMDRASSFIAALPEAGAAIVVPAGYVGKWLKDGIVALRGKAYARQCPMIIIAHHGHCSKLWGLNPHVVVSPEFAASNVKAETKAEVYKLVRGIIGIDLSSQPDMAPLILKGGEGQISGAIGGPYRSGLIRRFFSDRPA